MPRDESMANLAAAPTFRANPKHHASLEERLQHIKTPMSLSVLGCVVNGPGEARETDIGITGGGNGKHMVFLSGVTDHHVQDADMIEHIVRLVEAKAAEIEAATASDMVLDAAE